MYPQTPYKLFQQYFSMASPSRHALTIEQSFLPLPPKQHYPKELALKNTRENLLHAHPPLICAHLEITYEFCKPIPVHKPSEK